VRLLALIAVLLSYAGPAAGAANGPIAFASGDALYALDGSAEAPIPNGTGGSWPAWSPDGSRIAFAVAREKHADHPLGPKDCGQIRWMAATGGSTHVVINGEPHITGISWSPDGAWLAVGFEHQNMTRSCGDDRPLGIAKVRLDGSGLHGLGPDLATDPDWSPDGRWIAYRDWRRTCHACGEIWVVRPDGSHDHVLTPVPASAGGLRMPRYSPSGKRLVALGDGVVVLDHDGTIRRVIVRRATSVDW
jgi:Tol biopolymer transport system component